MGHGPRRQIHLNSRIVSINRLRCAEADHGPYRCRCASATSARTSGTNSTHFSAPASYPARKLKRAQILLAADAGATYEEIAISVEVGGSAVYRTKRRFALGDPEAALSEEPRPGVSRKLSGKEEALVRRLAALVGLWSCCSMNTEHVSISRAADQLKTSSSRGAKRLAKRFF